MDSPTEGVVKVTDFGLGRAATQTAVGSIVYSQSMNDAAAGEIAGTLDYMAPEQRSGGRDRRPRGPLRLRRGALRTAHRRAPGGHRSAQRSEPAGRRSISTRSSEKSYARLDKRYASADEFLRGIVARRPAAA